VAHQVPGIRQGEVAELGCFPDVSLKQARDRRDDARRDLAKGIDPSAKRRTETLASSDTFEAIAREWFEKFSSNWVEGYSSKVIRRLEICVFPWIGSMPISHIKAPDLLACLRSVEARCKLGTAHRALQVCGRVFRYAVATGRAERDPSADLRGALPPVKEKHHASFTDPSSLAGLLRAIDSYDGSNVVRSALRLAPMVFVRPSELRAAEWQEFSSWAGEYRGVNIGKGGFQFAHAPRISGLMSDLKRDALRRHTPCRSGSVIEVALALAEVHAELILVHPLRDGNGRVARLLAFLMALQAGLPPLDFSPMAGRGKRAYIAAIHAGMNRDYSPLAAIMARAIECSMRAASNE
jgi:integrase